MLVVSVRPSAHSQTARPATLKTASAIAPDIPYHEYEFQVEEEMLQMANQARQHVGAPTLTLDPGLTAAARVHAEAMLEAHQLSHQFSGELSLVQRLAATGTLQLDLAAENVALDYSAQGGHDHLMLSPPHRANLLNPAYNVVGLGVVRTGDRLYIVQDFAHALPAYSPDEVKDHVAAAVNRMRQDVGRRPLSRHDLLNADIVACSMAKADRLGTASVRKLAGNSTVLTYTSLHPETLPAEASHAIRSPNLHTFSVGACYSRTDTYPTGINWIVLLLN